MAENNQGRDPGFPPATTLITKNAPEGTRTSSLLIRSQVHMGRSNYESQSRRHIGFGRQSARKVCLCSC